MDPDLFSQWAKQVTLGDGTELKLRAISPGDDKKMLSLFQRLSPDTIYHRFMGVMRYISPTQLHKFTHIDFSEEMAIVCTAPEENEGEKLVAVGRYVRKPNSSKAELAFTVEDSFQGRGIGTMLLVELVPFAREHGIKTLEAEVLADNKRMMEIFRHRGYHIRSSIQNGVCHVEFPIDDASTLNP